MAQRPTSHQLYLFVKELLMLRGIGEPSHEAFFCGIYFTLEVCSASYFGIVLLEERVIALQDESGLYFL